MTHRRRGLVLWLWRECEVPLDHVAYVLELDLAALDAWIKLPRKGGLFYSRRRRPPMRTTGSSDCRPIAGPLARYVRRLSELGYAAARIADVLSLDTASVRDYLARLTPLSADGGQLLRPRGRSDHRASRRAARRRQRDRARASRLAWHTRDSTSELPGAIPCPSNGDVDLVEETIAETSLSPLCPAPWTGGDRMQCGELHGRAKLTWHDVDEIRSDRAIGVSIRQLAMRWAVSCGTIRAIDRCVTWRPCDRPASLPPALPRQLTTSNSLENP
jgi:hypothetical protein